MPSVKALKRKAKKSTGQRHGTKAKPPPQNSAIQRQRKLMKLEELAGYYQDRRKRGEEPEFAYVAREPDYEQMYRALETLVGEDVADRWVAEISNGSHPLKYANKIHSMFIHFFGSNYVDFMSDSDDDESYMESQVRSRSTRRGLPMLADVEDDTEEEYEEEEGDNSDYDEEEEEEDVEYFDYNKNEDGAEDDDEGELLFQ